jgi:hypothetical protein
VTAKQELEYEMEKQNYQTFMEERKILIAEEQKQASSFDKYLLTFATGTFGLTVTFIKDITNGTIVASTKWMIILAWTLLATTIILMLMSFLSTLKANRKQVEIDKKYFITDKGKKTPGRNRWNTVTLVLNIISSAAFVVALLFLFVFVSGNMPITS